MLVSDLRIMCNIHAYFDFYRTVNSLDLQLYISHLRKNLEWGQVIWYVHDVAMLIE